MELQNQINKNHLNTGEVFPTMVTVPDCLVVGSNKLGGGHGERKLYISSKDTMHEFFGKPGFTDRCFLLKSDLLTYMKSIENEYKDPSQNYAGKEDLPKLWKIRMEKVQHLNDIIYFDIHDQTQIQGPRGYVNSEDKNYNLIRELALPLVSYIYIEKIEINKDNYIYYWRLFVDFEAIWEKKNGPLVFNYGNNKHEDKSALDSSIQKEIDDQNKQLANIRNGQQRYREQLLLQCPFCPITKISDERLLIASHIKPWAASSKEERIDPYNGFILSPLYDALFDKGFITFTKNRHIVISNYISPHQWKLIGLKGGEFIQALPMDEKREKYLEFHHDAVFKGKYPQ